MVNNNKLIYIFNVGGIIIYSAVILYFLYFLKFYDIYTKKEIDNSLMSLPNPNPSTNPSSRQSSRRSLPLQMDNNFPVQDKQNVIIVRPRI